MLVVADGGTSSFDAVGDLPLDAQVMLPRFLQSHEVQPVGSTETKGVDVQLIAATHRDPDAAVERVGPDVLRTGCPSGQWSVRAE